MVRTLIQLLRPRDAFPEELSRLTAATAASVPLQDNWRALQERVHQKHAQRGQ